MATDRTEFVGISESVSSVEFVSSVVVHGNAHWQSQWHRGRNNVAPPGLGVCALSDPGACTLVVLHISILISAGLGELKIIASIGSFQGGRMRRVTDECWLHGLSMR